MNPQKVDRQHLSRLTDLPNIGKAAESDLLLIGITHPNQLIEQDPIAMYHALCEKTRTKHDPCVLDVFISITRFMRGEDAKAWWHYTAERQQMNIESRQQ